MEGRLGMERDAEGRRECEGWRGLQGMERM